MEVPKGHVRSMLCSQLCVVLGGQSYTHTHDKDPCGYSQHGRMFYKVLRKMVIKNKFMLVQLFLEFIHNFLFIIQSFCEHFENFSTYTLIQDSWRMLQEITLLFSFNSQSQKQTYTERVPICQDMQKGSQCQGWGWVKAGSSKPNPGVPHGWQKPKCLSPHLLHPGVHIRRKLELRIEAGSQTKCRKDGTWACQTKCPLWRMFWYRLISNCNSNTTTDHYTVRVTSGSELTHCSRASR